MANKVASFYKTRLLPLALRATVAGETELREELEDGIEYKLSAEGKLDLAVHPAQSRLFGPRTRPCTPAQSHVFGPRTRPCTPAQRHHQVPGPGRAPQHNAIVLRDRSRLRLIMDPCSAGGRTSIALCSP